MLLKYLYLFITVSLFTILAFKTVRYPKHRICCLLLSVLFFLFELLDSYLIIAGGAVYWKYHYWMVGINCAFFGLWLSYLCHTLIGKKKLSGIVLLVASYVFLLIGMVNMSTVHGHEVALSSEKIKDSHRFVFLSDTHAGGPQSFKTLEKAVEEINGMDVEFVVLGGDITDENTSKAQMEKTFEILGRLKAPTYFIFGNHDRQTKADQYAKGRQYTEEEHKEALSKNGIQILCDDYQDISEDLVILGRMDRSYPEERKPYESYSIENKDACIIVFDHQGIPAFTSDLDHDADFQISGHTHAGQFFPVTFIYRLVHYNTVGFYRMNHTTIYISTGFAGWKIPFKTSGRCYYEVFNLTNGQ